MEATHRHTWVYHCWMTDADQVASCRDADSEMECPETLSHLDMTIRVNAHDRLVEALEAVATGIDETLVEANWMQMIEFSPEECRQIRAALALARGELE